MTVRLVSCPHCGHMLRLGSRECGQCGAHAPLLNQTSTHVVILAAIAAACIVVGTLLLS